MDYRFQVKLFGGKQRKTLLQIEAHLVTKNTNGSCSSSIVFTYTMFKDVIEQIKVLNHDQTFFCSKI